MKWLYVETSFYLCCCITFLHYCAWRIELWYECCGGLQRAYFSQTTSYTTHFYDRWDSIICITPWSLKLFSGLQRLILNNISKLWRYIATLTYQYAFFSLKDIDVFMFTVPKEHSKKSFHWNKLSPEMFHHIFSAGLYSTVSHILDNVAGLCDS